MPSDEPRTHATGVESDRILLFGTGAAVGWGVLSHDLALGGWLARSTSARTGRGVDVDTLADPAFTAATSIADLGGVKLWRYDAIVVTLGLNETVQLGSVSAWKKNIDQLLDYLVANKSRNTRIYLVGTQSITQLTIFDKIMNPLVSRHRAQIDRTTALLCGVRARAVFLEFNPVRDKKVRRTRSASDYRDGAAFVAACLAPPLQLAFLKGAAARRGPERVSGDSEAERQNGLDALGILDTPAERRFDEIVDFARRAFGTSFAALSMIDGDRQWAKSTAGIATVEMRREYSICATTIQQNGALVISDITADPRFSHFPETDGEPLVRFYAGFPIEAPTGERIGSLCVFDPVARDVRDVDKALLRNLALQVQTEIWLRAGEKITA